MPLLNGSRFFHPPAFWPRPVSAMRSVHSARTLRAQTTRLTAGYMRLVSLLNPLNVFSLPRLHKSDSRYLSQANRLRQDIPILEYRLQPLRFKHLNNLVHAAVVRDLELRGAPFH